MAKHLLRLRKRRAFLQGSPMWHIAIYPALAWAPIFGTSATLPGQPSPSGSTSSSLNGLFAAGARFEKGKWSADTMFMWEIGRASCRERVESWMWEEYGEVI